MRSIKSFLAGAALALLASSPAFADSGPWVETTATLSANDTFTGNTHYLVAAGGGTSGASFFGAMFASDQNGTAYIDSSNDGSNWTVASTLALTGGHTVDLNVPVRASYYRVRYVNGGSNQNSFRVFATQTQSGVAGQTTDGAGGAGAGGDASAANQVAVQAVAGSDASKATAVQGLTGGKPVGVSVADGGDATLGSKSDAKSSATDSTAVTIMQVLKQISASAQAGNANFGSAVPSSAIAVGANSSGNLTAIIQADASKKLSISTATTAEVVALSSGKKIYVTGWDAIANGTTTFKWVYGTGTNCGTGTTDLTDAYDLTAQAGLSRGTGLGPILVVPASNALCAVDSQAIHVGGSVSYTQF